MIRAVWAPAAAAPLLWLGLQKIARTPTARLAMAYRLVPQRIYPLGARLYLERLLAGGIVGETLPLANQVIDLLRDAPPGALLDVAV
jgi:hypothetical protein